MATYIMVYKSENPYDLSQLPKEQVTQVMKAWGEWLGAMGSAVKSPGDAFRIGGKSVSQSGVQEADNKLTGYSVVEAKDFDEALTFAKGSPVVANGGTVEVYEAFGVF